MLQSIKMKCDLCNKNEATVHLTRVFGDESQRVDLCEACAKAHRLNDPTGFSLTDLMEELRKSKKPDLE